MSVESNVISLDKGSQSSNSVLVTVVGTSSQQAPLCLSSAGHHQMTPCPFCLSSSLWCLSYNYEDMKEQNADKGSKGNSSGSVRMSSQATSSLLQVVSGCRKDAKVDDEASKTSL